MADGELSLIDKNITSLLEIPIGATVTSLNLHCNRISKIEGLNTAWHLRHLDLSSNQIILIEGLGSLASLRTLNLSCNLISKVEGLRGLVNLMRLNLSYNKISDLTGLLYLHGSEYKLKHINLQSNRVNSMSQLLQCMLGLHNLRSLTLSVEASGNPVCTAPGYRELVLQSLPQLSALDGVDRHGNPVVPAGQSVLDVPGMEDFTEFLLSSDTSVNNEKYNNDTPLPTPRIDGVLAQFRQQARAAMIATGDSQNERRIKQLEHQLSQLLQQEPSSSGSGATPAPVRKAKRDIDHTSESECDSAREGGGVRRRSRIPVAPSTRKRPGKDAKAQKCEKWNSGLKTPTVKTKRSACPRGKVCHEERAVPDKEGPAMATLRTADSKATNVTEESTYRAILEERDQERERRWKAEQAVKNLTGQVKELQTRASQEMDLQNMAVHTTDRLKELLLKERSGRAELQRRVEELAGKERAALEELAEARRREERQQRALQCLEDSASRSEASRARQQAEELKRNQELENKTVALKREVELLRASARQHKDKLQQMHELLASREQAHRTELETRVVPGGAEFREAVSRELSAAEERHAQQLANLQEKLSNAGQRYAALEDEFRMALSIEASRFAEVKEGFGQRSSELTECRAALSRSQSREKESAALVQELTAMVKEQKRRIAELIRAKREAVSELKARVRTLEAGAEEDKRRSVQLELLKQDKSRLLSQLTAQESVIDGLRAQRKIWGQELAQQGASLAQDRGRLEARIEVLATELETVKKQNESDNDALKIKAKIVDDQTETIRKLKEALQGRDEQIRRLREEGALAQRQSQERLESEAASQAELRARVEQLSDRKEQLKEQLEDKEAELQELKRGHSAMNKNWQEKAELLTRLESQVKRMKEGFDAKERLLVEEKEKAQKAYRAAMEKLRSADDAFRLQAESMLASQQAELMQLASEKQTQIELANQRVLQVEEEMRQLLEETERSKRLMEEKTRRLTSVLRDF